MSAQIPVLSPSEVKAQYLQPGSPIEGIRPEQLNSFNIIRIEDLLPFIKFPKLAFRNTAHGFIFVQQGLVDIKIDVQHHTIDDQQILLTPAGQVQGVLHIAPETTGYMALFDDLFLASLKNTVSIEPLQQLLDPSNSPHIHLDERLNKTFVTLCDRLLELLAGSSLTKEPLIYQYLNVFLAEFLRCYQQPEHKTRGAYPDLVIQFKQALSKHIHENPKPADMARLLHISTNHLNKVLKQHTRFSTREWINRRQIIEAKLLLCHSSASISEIAFSLGFEDPSYFSKFFHRHCQQSPSQYRQD